MAICRHRSLSVRGILLQAFGIDRHIREVGIAIQKCQSGQRRQVPPIVQSRVNRWLLRSDAKHIARTAWERNQRYRRTDEGSLAKLYRPSAEAPGAAWRFPIYYWFNPSSQRCGWTRW